MQSVLSPHLNGNFSTAKVSVVAVISRLPPSGCGMTRQCRRVERSHCRFYCVTPSPMVSERWRCAASGCWQRPTSCRDWPARLGGNRWRCTCVAAERSNGSNAITDASTARPCEHLPGRARRQETAPRMRLNGHQLRMQGGAKDNKHDARNPSVDATTRSLPALSYPASL
jgi:hypothetical protein